MRKKIALFKQICVFGIDYIDKSIYTYKRGQDRPETQHQGDKMNTLEFANQLAKEFGGSTENWAKVIEPSQQSIGSWEYSSRPEALIDGLEWVNLPTKHIIYSPIHESETSPMDTSAIYYLISQSVRVVKPCYNGVNYEGSLVAQKQEDGLFEFVFLNREVME